jgi:phospholipid/cholesterol/gamma-HCH transport system substrate-binding protein
MAEKHSTRQTGDPFIRRHRTFFVGLFVIVPLLLIPGLLVYTLAKSEVFQGWTRLHVKYDQSYGLGKGNQVTISGMSIGYVNRMSLVREGCIDVGFKINRRYRPVVKKDTRALLRQKSLMGDWEIRLTGGSDSVPAVNDNDTLVPDYSLGLDQLTGQATDMIGRIDTIVRQIAAGKGAIGKILIEDSLVTQVQSILQNVNRITGRSSGMMKQVDTLLASLNTIGASSVTMVDSIKTVMNGVQKAMADAQVIVGNVKGASGNFNPMINQVQSNLDQAEIMMRGLQKNWLIQKLTGKPEDRMLKNDP